MPEPQPVAAPGNSPVASSAAPTAAPPATPSVAPPAGLPVAVQTWNDVHEAGSYVCNDTGRLLRVPASGLREGRTPSIEILGPQGPSKVTRLSEDPALPIADLRRLSSGASITPQF